MIRNAINELVQQSILSILLIGLKSKMTSSLGV